MADLQPLALHQTRGIGTFFERAAVAAKGADMVLCRKSRLDMANKAAVDTHLKAWAADGMGRLLGWAMGSGKTRTGLQILAGWRSWANSLDVISMDMQAALRRPHLIVAKANGIHVWNNQLRYWFPDAPETWIVNPTTGKQVEKAVEDIQAGRSKVLAISYSMLARHVDKVDGVKFALGIFDEVQALTNPTTDRSQAIYRLMRLYDDGLPGIAFKVAMSGTPFTNKVTDLWPVLAMLQGYSVPIRYDYAPPDAPTYYQLRSPRWESREKFERTYSIAVGASGQRVPINLLHDPKAHFSCNLHRAEECKHLHPRLIKHVLDRVTADEAWPNLPPAEPQWVPVEMGPNQKKVYADLVNDEVLHAVTEKGKESNIAIERMALMVYAFEALASTRQLESSAKNKGRAGLPIKTHESGMLKHIIEMAEDMDDDEPFIVFAGFKDFAREIAEHPALQHKRPLLLTSDSNLKNADAERLFQEGKSNMIVATVKGIEAMTLTRCRVLIVAGFLSWSPLDIQQAIYRIRRPGQKAERLLIYCLYHEGTLLAWLRGKLARKLEYGVQALDGVEGGSEELSLRSMTTAQFQDAFFGK